LFLLKTFKALSGLLCADVPLTVQYNAIKQFVSRTVVDYLVESEARMTDHCHTVSRFL